MPVDIIGHDNHQIIERFSLKRSNIFCIRGEKYAGCIRHYTCL